MTTAGLSISIFETKIDMDKLAVVKGKDIHHAIVNPFAPVVNSHQIKIFNGIPIFFISHLCNIYHYDGTVTLLLNKFIFSFFVLPHHLLFLYNHLLKMNWRSLHLVLLLLVPPVLILVVILALSSLIHLIQSLIKP